LRPAAKSEELQDKSESEKKQTRNMKKEKISLKPLFLIIGIITGMLLAIYFFLTTPGKLIGVMLNPRTLLILLVITAILFWTKTNEKTNP
jgi:polyferredoxin